MVKDHDGEKWYVKFPGISNLIPCTIFRETERTLTFHAPGYSSISGNTWDKRNVYLVEQIIE